MAEVLGTLLGFDDRIAGDGSVKIRAKPFEGEPFDFVVTQDQIAELIPTFQGSVLKAYTDRKLDIPAPTIAILACQAAFQGTQAALLVATDQIGTLALRAEPPVLRAIIEAATAALEKIERRPN